MHWLARTELLVGEEKTNKLRGGHVLVAGLGGVGAYAAEQLCRAGIGELTIVDGDTIHETNINRQLPALHSTLGMSKARVMAKRLVDINPHLRLHVHEEYIRDGRMTEILSNRFDYVVDAIDTLSPKFYLIYHSLLNGHRLVSSMGSGGKVDPLQVQIADISQSHSCPLARNLRKRLHRKGVYEGFKVVFSSEEVPEHAMTPCHDEPNKKTTLGTISYMPPLFGCLLASVVVRDIISPSRFDLESSLEGEWGARGV